MVKKGQQRPPRSEDWCRHISEGKKGKTRGAANHFFGKHHTKATKMAISQILIANPIFKREGERHWNWQGGVTDPNHEARNTQDLKSWRRAVYQRDNYTCQRCGLNGVRKHPIEAHHIKAFAFYPELRFEVTNGITLCKECHKYETSRLNLFALLEGARQRGQRDRILCYEHRVEVNEQLNTVELIRERGFLSYWTDNSTHYLPRLIPTKKEAQLDGQIDMILSEAMKGETKCQIN